MIPRYEPAYPVPDCAAFQYSGMSVRVHFAGFALTGLLAGQYSANGRHNFSEVVQESYSIAEAMLVERMK